MTDDALHPFTICTCDGCGNRTEHDHMHDTAHGIAETHMSGSERFVCKLCGHMTFVGSPGAEKFRFVLDGQPTRSRKVER